MSDEIETPLSSGVTDHPDVPQEGSGTGFKEDFSHVKLVGAPKPLTTSSVASTHTPVSGDFSQVKLVGKPKPIATNVARAEVPPPPTGTQDLQAGTKSITDEDRSMDVNSFTPPQGNDNTVHPSAANQASL